MTAEPLTGELPGELPGPGDGDVTRSEAGPHDLAPDELARVENVTPAEVFAHLAATVYASDSMEDVFAAIARSAVELVPGVDHACVSTLRRDGRLECHGSTDKVAALVDELQNEVGEGPCMASVHDESSRYHLDPDITHHSTWPKLSRLARERTPVRGMVGYALARADGLRGALNLFSDTPGALTEEAAETGAILAAFASVALDAVDQRDTATSLRAGLDSNREIGKAIGILMASHGLTADEALEVLRRASSHTNTRMVSIAERITRDHHNGIEQSRGDRRPAS